MLKRLSDSELFEARAYIVWDFLLTCSPKWPGVLPDAHAGDFRFAFLLLALARDEFTGGELHRWTSIYGDPILDVMKKWVDNGIVEREFIGDHDHSSLDAVTLRLAIFPPGHEELLGLVRGFGNATYLMVLAETNAAMCGTPRMKEVVRQAILRWRQDSGFREQFQHEELSRSLTQLLQRLINRLKMHLN